METFLDYLGTTAILITAVVVVFWILNGGLRREPKRPNIPRI